MIAARVPADERIVLPAVSSVSLAAGVLGWGVPDVATVSLCGRPVATLVPYLQPGGRVLILSEDGSTPGRSRPCWPSVVAGGRCCTCWRIWEVLRRGIGGQGRGTSRCSM